jgi:hypothetical protein
MSAPCFQLEQEPTRVATLDAEDPWGDAIIPLSEPVTDDQSAMFDRIMREYLEHHS